MTTPTGPSGPPSNPSGAAAGPSGGAADGGAEELRSTPTPGISRRGLLGAAGVGAVGVAAG
ncbi:MAG: hypothetical protein JWP61_1290, partial [Friedmanniella sp.]|nr:hypothetical protein [Friedmanniella sp.]